MALDGIDAEFTWADGSSNKVRAGLDSTFKHQSEGISINVVTLTQQQAEQLFVLEGEIFYSPADLFRDGEYLTAYRQANSDLSGFIGTARSLLNMNIINLHSRTVLSTTKLLLRFLKLWVAKNSYYQKPIRLNPGG